MLRKFKPYTPKQTFSCCKFSAYSASDKSLDHNPTRIEIFSPLPHGHQAPKSTTPRFGSEVKSICPVMRPPRSSLITPTVSGALPTFTLSQAALRCCSKVARILSFPSTPNSAKTASKRASHFHVKVPWNALDNSRQTLSTSNCNVSFTRFTIIRILSLDGYRNRRSTFLFF